MEAAATAYEYKFVRIGVKQGWGWVAKPEEAYRDVVTAHAKEGWRLVQVFAPGLSTHGKSTCIDVIFERPAAPALGRG